MPEILLAAIFSVLVFAFICGGIGLLKRAHDRLDRVILGCWLVGMGIGIVIGFVYGTFFS